MVNLYSIAVLPTIIIQPYGSLSVLTAVSIEKGMADLLKEAETIPRLFSFAEPIPGEAAGDFANYEGVDAGLTCVGPANRFFCSIKNSQAFCK